MQKEYYCEDCEIYFYPSYTYNDLDGHRKADCPKCEEKCWEVED